MHARKIFAALIWLASLASAEGWCGKLKASDGALLAYERHGAGPSCIFVHGGPGQGYESFRQMGGDRLEALFDLIYLDERGSGHSPDSGNYHLYRMVEDIEELRQKLALPRVCLIAHSFGGLIANAYARAHPDHVTALVMINTTLHFLDSETLRMQILEMRSRMGQHSDDLAGMTQEELFELRDKVRAEFNKTDKPYALFTERVETVQKMNSIDGGYQRHRGFGNAVMARPTAYPEYFQSQVETTPFVLAPVLVVAGSHDYMVGPEHHTSYRYPHATVRVLECGHLPFYDCPRALFEAVSEFRNQYL